MKATIIITLMVCCISQIACQRKLKFDQAKWDSKDDMERYPYRDAMLDDLMKNHQLKGLTYKELTTQIGEPARYDSDLNNPYYNIIVDYSSDIDPVYTKVLSVKLNKDSVVTDFNVEEWRKE